MAMSYEESNALMQDMAFRGRVKVAAVVYAQYLALLPATNAQMRWIQTTMSQPDQMAGTLTPPTVMNPDVQAAGPTVSDEVLQAAVQSVANQIM
jgi:hypothetical protein